MRIELKPFLKSFVSLLNLSFIFFRIFEKYHVEPPNPLLQVDSRAAPISISIKFYKCCTSPVWTIDTCA